MVSPDNALSGRKSPVLSAPKPHAVNGSEILNRPAGCEIIFLAAGCYWGVEEIYWETVGVKTTAVGFMGGYTPNPTYEEVCTGLTGHTETVRVVYDPQQISIGEILQIFFECHDPTSLHRQGNDIGTQYRSAIFTTTDTQFQIANELKAAYQEVLTQHGKGEIITEIHAPGDTLFFPAEDAHQQYLSKNPDGYRCHSKSGIACPIPGAGPLHLD
ncbi:peptide-methionine (S)-S-oxide reductase MsrA [Arcanobacterium hippocoleae]|uniref:peptide-methionine (S)-S-oxide reductase MsrA n=1 Tax=Arcanobacterium hippocoleae TaxID=149017 RepID=UPI003DA7702E